MEYLGFAVLRLGHSGEPEGVATAWVTPDEDDATVSYTFTFDAKASITGKAKAKDVGTSGLTRHREHHKANYTLVVAPDYELGALQEECRKNAITPMRAKDLAKLLMLAAATGPLDLAVFRSAFDLRDPDDVQEWVATLCQKVTSAPRLSLGLFLHALEGIGYAGPNAITVGVIADRIAQLPDNSYKPKRQEIRNLVAGMAVLVPGLVRITGDNVFLSTSPQKLREAILAQIATIPSEYRFGIDKVLTQKSDT